MQDIGSKEDTELSRRDLTFSSQESRVQFLGRCRYIGKLHVFPENTSLIGVAVPINAPAVINQSLEGSRTWLRAIRLLNCEDG
jgi:hypothetical protein